MGSGNYRDRFGGLGPFGAVTASAVAGVLRGLRGWANDGWRQSWLAAWEAISHHLHCFFLTPAVLVRPIQPLIA